MPADMVYPDAYVREGRITDLLSGDDLPSYQGLVLANFNGRFCILFTQLDSKGRDWQIVSWGSQVSTTEIEKFTRGKQ